MCIRSDYFATFWVIMKNGHGNKKFRNGAY